VAGGGRLPSPENQPTNERTNTEQGRDDWREEEEEEAVPSLPSSCNCNAMQAPT